MLMRGRLLFALIFIASAGALQAIDFQIEVYDPKKGELVPDAQVVIIEARKQYTTDEKGIAKASVPQIGFYTVRIITNEGGFRQLRMNVLSGGRTIRLLTSDAPPASKKATSNDDAVVVTGSREKQKLSRYRIRLDEVKRIPGAFGEALRGLETLPGITAPSFGSGDIIVRGANANANFYMLDDLPIGYAFHFLGLNSVVHNDIISAIDIYTGAYPVQYGDATGGIISIETIDEVKKFGGHASFSLWSANALFKGPIGENKGYWIFAGRGSCIEHTLGQYIPDGIRAPRYGDGQFKLHFQPTPAHSFYLYVMGAKDTFAAKLDDRPSWDPTTEPDPIFFGASIALDRAYHTEAIRHVWRPGSRFNMTSSLYYFNDLFFIDGSLGIIDARVKQERGWGAFKNVSVWEVFEKKTWLELGLEARSFQYFSNGTTVRPTDPNDQSADPFDPGDFANVPVRDSSVVGYNSGYLMLTQRFGGLEIKPGARVDYFGLTKQRVIDPRGTISYKFDSTGTTLLGGAGVYHRVPDPNQYSPSSGNPNLRLERAEHYGGGVEQKIGKRWIVKTEVFRHYFTDIVVADPYITTPVRENQDPYERYETPLLLNDRLGYSNDGTGFSEGYEIYIKREIPPDAMGWYGWVSYSWSRSIRNDHQHIITDEEKKLSLSADERRILYQYDNTKDHYAEFDQTVIINIIFGYKINPEWQIGSRWKYATSPPHTPIIGDDGGRTRNGGRPIFDPNFAEDLTNAKRLGPYHRLDIRVDRFFNYTWGFGSFFVEALNVYLRKNPEGISFDRARPYSAANPSVQDGFGNLEIPSGKGRSARIPLMNFGVEVKF